ncbi:uncharacterized protein LOC109605426 [Aethina tumida]|uniref:uncharacterized protein LOC109605426 n=1 Tax=Aethina tumida TaxID=116153 RepID=UPI00096B1954|nr:uncharacterized protein LOC109605426 [Aethina tumida]
MDMKNGSGDCGSKQKRIPVPSSRKFNARAPPMEEEVRMQLKTAMEVMDESVQTRKITKARTVAEIHPTKTKVKRRSLDATTADEVTVHVTPRRQPDEEDASPASPHLQESIACRFYRRLLLNAWRRSRHQLTAIDDASRRQKEQIAQLEMQITLLKKLNKTESEKRNDALLECQNTKSTLEKVEVHNQVLTKELDFLKMELEKNENHVRNAQLEIDQHNNMIAILEENLRIKMAERDTLQQELKMSNGVIKILNKKVSTMENVLTNTKEMLKETQEEFSFKFNECEELTSQLEDKTDENELLEKELKMYKDQLWNLEQHIEVLQDELADNVARLDLIRRENESMKSEIEDVNCELMEEKKSSWWKSTKQLATLSLNALETAAQIMLPAYLD